MTAPNTPAETSDQLNKPAKSGKLEVSDLITIGVFAALYFVMVCIATLVSTLFTSGFGSIFLPAITALISGCVYMLLAARLGKFGGITVMGVINRTVPVHLRAFRAFVHRQHRVPGGGRPYRARRQV